MWQSDQEILLVEVVTMLMRTDPFRDFDRLAQQLIGAGTTLFTGLGVLFSGLRQLAIGFAAAGVTFGVGKLIGAAVTG